MNIVEFLGAPGSGKSFFFNIFSKFLRKKKLLFYTPLDLLINQYLMEKKKGNTLLNKIYFIYAKNFKLNSNFLFKKESIDFQKFIKKKKANSKKLKKILNLYKDYLDDSYFCEQTKKRMIKNMEINYLGLSSDFSKKKMIVCEEGIFQKLFLKLNYKKNKSSNIDKNIEKILSIFPKPKIILFFKTDFELCLKRVRRRKSGFTYYKKDIFILNSQNYFNTIIFDYIKKNKIKMYRMIINKKLILNDKYLTDIIKNWS